MKRIVNYYVNKTIEQSQVNNGRIMTFEDRISSVKRLMAADPKGTMKMFELIKEFNEINNQWNDSLEDYHLYKLCKTILLDNKLNDLLKEE